MRARVPLAAAAVVLCATAVAFYATRDAPEPGATAAPGPTVTVTPTATPTPTPTVPPAEPFDLAVENTILRNMDHSWMIPLDPPELDEAAAEDAAQQAVETLTAFLDAQFVHEATRFSEETLDVLLVPAVLDDLDDEGRQALGALDLGVHYTRTGQASATPQVLILGSSVVSVTVEFDAALTVFDDSGGAPVSQRGSLLFTETDHGWRVAGLEVTLDGPEGQRSGSGGEASPDPTVSPSRTGTEAEASA